MKLPAMGAAKKYHEVEALARVLLPEIQCREDRRRIGTAASHSLQLREGNEHSQRTGTAHLGRHRQHQKRRVRELHDRRQIRRLSRKKASVLTAFQML